MSNYLEKDAITKIIISRESDGNVTTTNAKIYTIDHKVKTLTVGNVDNFLEALEKY